MVHSVDLLHVVLARAAAANRRLAFLPSDCAAVHAGEQDSALEGGFSLNGCDAAGGEY